MKLSIIGVSFGSPIMLNFVHAPRIRDRYYYTDTINQDISYFYEVALKELEDAKKNNES